MSKIDIIIPIYKAHDTLGRALASIACQWGKEDIIVTLVNDACPERSYDDIIERFKPELCIQELKLEQNQGPGDARQLGMDKTQGDYIFFMDSDDCLASALSIFFLRNELDAHPELVVVSGQVIEQMSDLSWGDISGDNIVWLFGKMYRRNFLQNNNIRFKEGSRSNEDVGFNSCVAFLTRGHPEMTKLVDVTVYIWMQNVNSITRRNNNEYQYRDGTIGFVDNLIYAYNFIAKRGFAPSDRLTLFEIATWICTLHISYNSVLEERPQYIEELWPYYQKLYDKCIRPNKNFIAPNCWREAWLQVILEEAGAGRLFWHRGTIIVSFNDFLYALDRKKGAPEARKLISMLQKKE